MSRRLYLRPGELIITEVPTIVTTVLGSCVAVMMFHSRTRVGAICHAMLPWCHSDMEKGFRYVDTSIRHMTEKFREKGIDPRQIEVKLAGGADVLDRVSHTTRSVGEVNVEAVLELLKTEGLRLAAYDVGGLYGRKVHFHTCTGNVLVSKVNRLSPEGVLHTYVPKNQGTYR